LVEVDEIRLKSELGLASIPPASIKSLLVIAPVTPEQFAFPYSPTLKHV